MARKEKKYHFIYKTTNLLSGKYYIGMHSTDDLNDGYMGSGRRLRFSINKHGKENHKVEILEFVSSRAELIAREKDVVNLDELAKEDCMNLMVGGKGGFISDEQQRHRSKSASDAAKRKLENDPELRKKFSDNGSKMMFELHKKGLVKHDTFTGKKHTKKTIELIRQMKKGQGVGSANSQFGTCWITKDNVDKKIAKENLTSYLDNGWVKGRKKSGCLQQ